MYFHISLFFTLVPLFLADDPFMFQVGHSNHTIQLLKQLNFGQKSELWQEEVFSKLGDWEHRLDTDPLLFEHPVENFKFLKMLRLDIEEFMIPRRLRTKFRKIVRVPTRNDLRKSALLIQDMITMFGIPIHQAIIIITLYFVTYHQTSQIS